VFVNLNDTKVCCRLAPDVAPQVGESLTLQFDPAKVLLFDAKTGERLGVPRPSARTLRTLRNSKAAEQ
jgi:multiple sugar transport system ATP-binding protein